MRILIVGSMSKGRFEQAHIDALRRYIRPDDELLLKSGEGGILSFVWKTIDVIIAVNEPVSIRDVEMAPQLKLVLSFSDNLIKNISPLLEERHINSIVTNQTALIGVAEHSVMMMLALTKQLVNSDTRVRRGDNPLGVATVDTGVREMAYNWLDLKDFDVLYGKTVGIIGFGTVGQRVAKIANGFEMKIQYYSKTRKNHETEDMWHASYAPLDDLLKTSDFVVMNAALTEETQGMMDADAFSIMKRTAYFINTARGKIVDEQALYEALKNGEIAGAGLDVFDKEPLPMDSPLRTLENVIFTAHSGGIPTYVSNLNAMQECGEILQSTYEIAP